MHAGLNQSPQEPAKKKTATIGVVDLTRPTKAHECLNGKKTCRLVRKRGTVVIASASSDGLGFYSLADRRIRLYIQDDRRKAMGDIFSGRKEILFSPNRSRADLLEHYPEEVIIRIQNFIFLSQTVSWPSGLGPQNGFAKFCLTAVRLLPTPLGVINPEGQETC